MIDEKLLHSLLMIAAHWEHEAEKTPAQAEAYRYCADHLRRRLRHLSEWRREELNEFDRWLATYGKEESAEDSPTDPSP